MALEPITRQEQIIAGKDLEPITRMEKFLKEYGGGGGASSWNDLDDKPFGEETTYGDTLTWDGNTEGLYGLDLQSAGENTHFLVSEITPTYEEITVNIDNMQLSTSSGDVYTKELVESLGMPSVIDMFGDGSCIMFLMGAVVVYEDCIKMMNNPETGENTTFEFKKGLYLQNFDGVYFASLTINGYNGFETKVVKPIDNKYLEPFETVGGDTLTWDGNTEGLECAEGVFYKVSDVTPTVADMTGGVTISFMVDGTLQTLPVPAEGIMEDNGIISFDVIFVVLEDIDAGEEVIKKGVYFLNDGGEYTTAFTINGYTGFTTTKLKEEYLPEQSSGVTTFYSGYNHRLYLDPYQEEMVKKSDIITAMKKGVIRIGDGDGDSGTYEYPISIDTVSDSAYITIVKWTDDSVTIDYFVTAEEFEG